MYCMGGQLSGNGNCRWAQQEIIESTNGHDEYTLPQESCQTLRLQSLNLARFVTALLPLSKNLHRPPLPLHLAPNRVVSLNGSPVHPPRPILHNRATVTITVCLRLTRRRVSPKADLSRSAWPLSKALGRLVVARRPPHPRSRRRSRNGNLRLRSLSRRP